ncbi:MAG: helix-turn-helix transcriptional regulator [Bacilli bacterium]|nr:helix-turn-helix transcriptional regulator [Bacilli bacterium]
MNQIVEIRTIALNIKNLRLSRNMTQFDMGDLLGYSDRQIRRLEKEGTMNIEVVNLIAKVFNIPVESILFKQDAFYILGVVGFL